MADSELHDQVAGYALGVLDADERAAFEEHLEQCERCRDEAAALAETASALAYAVEGPAPPDALRGRILAAARDERPNVVPLVRRIRVPPVVGTLAVAAACAAIAFGVWAGLLSSSLDEERAALRAQREAVAILADPGASRVALSGGAGTLVVSANGDAALAVSRLEPADPGKLYEAWVIPKGGKPLPAGVFDSEDGTATVKLRERVPKGGTVAVTEEDEEVDAPTGKPVLAAQVV
jgi:anti-sigma factor RsiW